MAATKDDNKPTTQKFSKGERSIPHHSQKASKYYPAEDVAVPKKVRSLGRSSTTRYERGGPWALQGDIHSCDPRQRPPMANMNDYEQLNLR